jgi:hypothetical protein
LLAERFQSKGSEHLGRLGHYRDAFWGLLARAQRAWTALRAMADRSSGDVLAHRVITAWRAI